MNNAAKADTGNDNNWLFHVFSDPDFIDLVNAQVDDAKIAELFCIQISDISKYKLSQAIFLDLFISERGRFIPDLVKRKVTMEFDLDISKSEYLEIWEKFAKYRKGLNIEPPPTKRKGPENLTLVYAVFKERNKGSTFNEIFDLYINNKLPGYDGKANMLTSKKLEEYYNLYKPEI